MKLTSLFVAVTSAQEYDPPPTDHAFGPQHSITCCIEKCKQHNGKQRSYCYQGCKVWNKHTSLNWDASYQAGLKGQCKKKCDMASSQDSAWTQFTRTEKTGERPWTGSAISYTAGYGQNFGGIYDPGHQGVDYSTECKVGCEQFEMCSYSSTACIVDYSATGFCNRYGRRSDGYKTHFPMRNRVELNWNEEQCRNKAREIRNQCFMTEADGPGSISTTWVATGEKTTVATTTGCKLEYSNEGNGGGVSQGLPGDGECPHMNKKREPNDQWDMSHIEYESAAPWQTGGSENWNKAGCFKRAENIRNDCYSSEADGQGSITATWLDTEETVVHGTTLGCKFVWAKPCPAHTHPFYSDHIDYGKNNFRTENECLSQNSANGNLEACGAADNSITMTYVPTGATATFSN